MTTMRRRGDQGHDGIMSTTKMNDDDDEFESLVDFPENDHGLSDVRLENVRDFFKKTISGFVSYIENTLCRFCSHI